MEAEYIALSTAMQSLLPIKQILKTLTTALDLQMDERSSISTVWEDNRAAEILATTHPPRLMSRSKHIAIRYHWFRDQLIPGKVTIQSIPSVKQKADILTKALAKHEDARKLSMGW
jgi:hypothetical protein